MGEVKDGHEGNECSGPKDWRRAPGKIGMLVFGAALVIGLIYAGGHLLPDLSQMPTVSVGPYVLLGVALLIALGWDHGGQPFGIAMGHSKKSFDGVGSNASCVDMLVGDSVLDV